MKPKQQYGPQQIALASTEGDIFWDIPPFIMYIAGAPIGASIYVANPSTEDREYSMISRLTSPTGEPLLEEAIAVYNATWFEVKAGDFVRLHAEVAFDFSNVVLTVALIERSTDSEVDSVFTYLVAPTAQQLPPNFPSIPGAAPTAAAFDWTSMFMMMMFIPIVGIVASAFREEEDKDKQKKLPLGRG